MGWVLSSSDSINSSLNAAWTYIIENVDNLSSISMNSEELEVKSTTKFGYLLLTIQGVSDIVGKLSSHNIF